MSEYIHQSLTLTAVNKGFPGPRAPRTPPRSPLVASLLLVAPSSVLAPSSTARKPLVASLILVVRPGDPSSVLAPSSTARSP